MYAPNLLNCLKRRFLVATALVFIVFAGASLLSVSAQTPDERDTVAQKALEEGVALFQQGTPESLRSAMAKLETALSLFRKTENQEQEATCLLGLGRVSALLYEFEKALEYYKQALSLYRALGKGGEAGTLNNIGDAYAHLGQYPKALEYHNQALPLLRAAGDKDEEAETLNHIGAIYDSIDEKRKALEYYNQALLIIRAVRNRKKEATTLNNIGLVYYSIGEHKKALEYYNQALGLRRAVGDRRGEATTLNNIGAVYDSLGEKRKALSCFEPALALSRASEDREGEAATLNNIGQVYLDLGEYQRALEYHTQALPLFRAVRDRRGEAATLNNMGFVYDSLYEMQKALDYYEQALPLFRTVEYRAGEARTLNNIGAAYDSLGDKRKALEYYNQALPLLRVVGDRAQEATTLNNVGFVYYSLGDYEKARDYYNQALSLRRDAGDRYGEAGTLNNFGALNYSLGNMQKALYYSNQALPIFRTVGDRAAEAKTLSMLMFICQALNNPRLAVFFGKQSVNRYQELRRAAKGLNKETQKTYLLTVADIYRALADLLIGQGRLPEGQFVLGLLKDEEFFEFVRRDKDEIAALSRSVELNEVERRAFVEYARLADDLTGIGAKYQLLFDKRSKLGDKPLLDAAEEAEFQKLSKQLTTTSDTFQKFLERLAAEFAKTNPAANIQIARVNDLQADLREVGPDVVLVSTFVLPDRYRVILTTGQTQVDHKTEIKAADLNRKLSCFLMALKNPRIDPRPLGKELYEILVKPLEQDLEKGKVKTILWSLDGALRYIPVAALWDGQHYLAERYQNAIITLGRNSRLFKDVNHDWRALGAGVSTKWPGFAELTAVKTELRSIVRDERVATETEGVLPGRRLLDDEFISSRLKDLLPSRENGRRFNLIHLASHFKLRQTRDSSFLLLGDGTELTLTEFDKDPRLKLTGVELLTLSACETGVGIEKGDGSEFESFGMLAEKNGAKAVMATLWQVADCSTGEFMREFYRLCQQGQQQGMTKAAALQRAQQAMLVGTIRTPAEYQPRMVSGAKPNVCDLPIFSANSAKPFAHPYYWAPFVLFGNWR